MASHDSRYGSIPLCILTSVICLQALGESLNVMTLGGLALAVGILVDNATVMTENVDTHLKMGKELDEAIIDAAKQIIVPTLLATLCICIVWLPLFTLSGVSGYLFKPMALAVIFAMLASFILSFTLVPTLAKYILVNPSEKHKKEGDESEGKPGGKLLAGEESQRGFCPFSAEVKASSGDFLPFSGGIRGSLSSILRLVWRAARTNH